MGSQSSKTYIANVAGLWPHRDNILKLRGNNLKTNYTHSSLTTIPPEHMFRTALPARAGALTQQPLLHTDSFTVGQVVLSAAAKPTSYKHVQEVCRSRVHLLAVFLYAPQLFLVPGKNYTRVQGRPCKARYCWSEHQHCRGQVGPVHGVAQTMVSVQQRLLVD